VQRKDNDGKMEPKASEVHVPTRLLIGWTLLIRRVAVEIAVIRRSCELEEETEERVRF